MTSAAHDIAHYLPSWWMGGCRPAVRGASDFDPPYHITLLVEDAEGDGASDYIDFWLNNGQRVRVRPKDAS